MPSEAEGASERHLRHALQLAERGLYTTDPNPRVGCVLVRDGAIVGEGWHVRAGEGHAEANALAAAGALARGATAYVTLEPCAHTGRTPPCADALIGAGIARVVCCGSDPNPKVAGKGFDKLRAAGIGLEIGLLASEARALNQGFFSRFERARPFVRLKMAVSLDGRTAAKGGGQLWISGEPSREDVQHWRARSSAILTGSGTVLADNPRLNVRLAYAPWVRQPLRVLLDSDLTCPADAEIFKGGGALVFAALGAPARELSVPVKRVRRGPAGLDLAAILAELAVLEMNEVMLECGATLAGSFLAQDLVDELILYIAPRFLGEEAAALANLPNGSGNGSYMFRDVRRIGDDVRLILERKTD
jgi:diaminohydroxyphosphoribosylaminopyrimidine deaminase/5-amino-6-(5-phosphoribosylamino)uracil reductase